MADGGSRPKRSRFDQTEPEPKRSSRFDRRSRSPTGRKESHRSRSPTLTIGRDDDERPKSGPDPAAAAAAAAARINASIQAKRGIQHVDVPPIKSTPSPATAKAASPPSATSATDTKVNSDMYIADGDYIKDIEINDLRNRYTITKGSTQKMIKEETGADVTTRGNYYPDKSMATAANPPLYLHVTSTTKEGLEQAVEKIEDLMKQELPNLVDERRFRRREPDFERDEFGRRKWPEDRVIIDMEPLPGFNLRAQVVGQQGSYVKHIQQETRCRVQIKGRGSGFTETATGQESDDPMYLHVAGPDAKDVERAKGLCEDLVASVRSRYEQHKANPPQRAYNPPSHESGGYGSGYGQSSSGGSGSGYAGYGGHGGYGGGGSSGGYGGYGSGYGSSGSAQSPLGASAPGTSGGGQDYSAQWAEYFRQNPQMAVYYGYGQPMQGSSSNDGPPPPPSGSPSNGGYNSVPPPPGM